MPKLLAVDPVPSEYLMLRNNPVHCENYTDWFNKEVDWPIAGQDKVRHENQTKDTGKKDRVRGVASKTWRRNRRCKMRGNAM